MRQLPAGAGHWPLPQYSCSCPAWPVLTNCDPASCLCRGQAQQIVTDCRYYLQWRCVDIIYSVDMKILSTVEILLTPAGRCCDQEQTTLGAAHGQAEQIVTDCTYYL